MSDHVMRSTQLEVNRPKAPLGKPEPTDTAGIVGVGMTNAQQNRHLRIAGIVDLDNLLSELSIVQWYM